MDRSAAPLLENAHAFLVMRNLYAAAGRQLTLKFEVLNSEFNVLYARNPIHHIESRVKSPESIAAKLLKKGLPLTLESAMQNVNDIAGVRVVCSYIDDVYRVASVAKPALVIVAVLCIAGLAHVAVRISRRALGRTLMAGGGLELAAFCALGAWAAIDFDGLFATACSSRREPGHFPTTACSSPCTQPLFGWAWAASGLQLPAACLYLLYLLVLR